ncbi:MAG TPA: 2-isopropylmalate synthase, partial [Phycisphaerae bacterium]|nr:2-isopropylmalate synthase [Phycisphaerae bacterium]
VNAITQIRQLADAMPQSDIRAEFSPEEFTDTEMDFSLEICTAVYEAWGKASPTKPLILNLPATVERRPPNHYADMIEIFCKQFKYRQNTIISVHAHNDQGMAVAATELALLAGADRVEGTLFGHGERTGNVDIVTLANNLASRGIETGLNFKKLPHIAETVARLTGMEIYYRQPYAGELVFTAFSGSHQDAIRKGLADHAKHPETWYVPYLHIDPADVGREYEGIIRINSQSGKGGVAFVLEQDYGLAIPREMQPELGRAVQKFSDTAGRELTSEEVKKIFDDEFLNFTGKFSLVGYWPRPDEHNPTNINGHVKIRDNGSTVELDACGNGPIDAFVHCIRKIDGLPGFRIESYHEQAIGEGADAQAMAYVGLKFDDGKIMFGVATDTNIDQAAAKAILTCINRKIIQKIDK